MAACRRTRSSVGVRLPVLYDSWPSLREDLKSLASKEAQGIRPLEELLTRHDKWGGIRLPLGLLSGVLDGGEVCTRQHFRDVQLPWLAETALAVENLFRDSSCKLQVCVCVCVYEEWLV
jgi:hypothetical protein